MTIKLIIQHGKYVFVLLTILDVTTSNAGVSRYFDTGLKLEGDCVAVKNL